MSTSAQVGRRRSPVTTKRIMKSFTVTLIFTAAVSSQAHACDPHAPLPTSESGLRLEKAELQLRLALIDQRLAAMGRSSNRGASSLAAPVTQPAPAQDALPSGCYVGPRGGTYTITKSGRKNYGGC